MMINLPPCQQIAYFMITRKTNKLGCFTVLVFSSMKYIERIRNIEFIYNIIMC